MAEAEVTLRYRELPILVANWLLLASVPVVTLFVLLCSISVWMAAGIEIGNASIFVLSLLFLMGFVILGILVTSDKTIYLTRDGISFPFAVCPGPGLRSQHNWSDLVAVRFLPGGKHGVLQLNFKRGAQTRLRLDVFKEDEIEKLIHSMDVWAGGSDSFPALLDARVKLLQQKDSSHHIGGFTEIWEEELTRRFGPTNFIPLEPGQEVNQLKVERQLAFGGLSAIYLVSDKNKKHSVLKEAVVPSDADETLRQTAENMLNKEAEILASLSHPQIARVLDNFLEEGRHYIQMELIEGEDLRQLVKENGPQPEADVLAWSLQLIEILEYLHSRTPPVVHRDLSPDNLMLRESGELCVIDFGAANHFVGTATGTLIGKQSYIAPEQLRGKAEPRSDIYAFGCTLNFLLTGQDPEPLAVAHPKQQKPAVSEKLDKLVASCTEQEASDRPASAAELRRLFKELGEAK